MTNVTIDQTKKKITIEMDLQDPKPSGSGKNLVIASTHGNLQTNAQVDGKTVVLGLNCYIKA